MPTNGVSMRKIKTILRLHYESHFSQHQIANSVQLSVGVINKYLKRAERAGLTWPLSPEYEDETVLKKALQPSAIPVSVEKKSINFTYIHLELRRKNVTLQLLFDEYKSTTAHPISYPHFCLCYRQWKNTQPRSMRQTHKAGDKVFVDYAGQTIDLIDTDTGEIRTAQIFVGVLGASNYTYAEATWTQRLPDWIGSHRRMFEFFGGVPALVVPDNLKSGVTKCCRYEPDINLTYADFIEYYGTAVLPARPLKPKDKAKAENSVLIVERWILARLRNRTFCGLGELNATTKQLLTELNHRPFKKLPGCRYSAYETLDKPMLKPLPLHPYEYTYFKKARVHIDYHIELEGHYYSVPFSLISQQIECRFTTTQIACWYQGKQIALHQRSYRKGAHTTVIDHMPKSHQAHSQWTPERFLKWGQDIGAATACLVKHLLEFKPHPEQGYRSCLGLLNLAKRFGDIKLEKACERAWKIGTKTRKSVESILINQLEDKKIDEENLPALPVKTHKNIRGKNYYF